MSRYPRVHRCDETCVCPVHSTPLYYWRAGDEHACQDPRCIHAHGMVIPKRREMKAQEANAARIHTEEFYFVIQRKHITSAQEETWVDTSSNYYGEAGEVAAVEKCANMQGIFGQANVRVVRRDVMVTEVVVTKMMKPVIGTVIIPEEDVSSYGGPSGHEQCRWMMKLPDGTVLGCGKTAGHHRLHNEKLINHLDTGEEMGWDALGRIWSA